jgi:hypothetical protein
MRKLTVIGALLSLVLLAGCAGHSIQEDVADCAGGFMDHQAHVLDATQACSHIYGLKNSREVRTISLEREPSLKGHFARSE